MATPCYSCPLLGPLTLITGRRINFSIYTCGSGPFKVSTLHRYAEGTAERTDPRNPSDCIVYPLDE
jgi:hypothetical protein